jgi:hypothetical protein
MRDADGLCPRAAALSGIYFDLHDLNTKSVQVNDSCDLVITAFSPGQTLSAAQEPWKVKSKVSKLPSCIAGDAGFTAMLDFQVPNKPDPPAQAVTAQFATVGATQAMHFYGQDGVPMKNVWVKLGSLTSRVPFCLEGARADAAAQPQTEYSQGASYGYSCTH